MNWDLQMRSLSISRGTMRIAKDRLPVVRVRRTISCWLCEWLKGALDVTQPLGSDEWGRLSYGSSYATHRAPPSNLQLTPHFGLVAIRFRNLRPLIFTLRRQPWSCTYLVTLWSTSKPLFFVRSHSGSNAGSGFIRHLSSTPSA